MKWKRYPIPINQFLHFPYYTSFSPKILHRRCLQFLLGQLEIPKRNFTQWLLDAKFWGVSEMYYGQCENDGLSLSIKTDYEVKHFFGMKCGIFFLPATFFRKPRLSVKCISSSNLQVYLLWIWLDGLLLYLCAWHTLYFFMGWNENWAV